MNLFQQYLLDEYVEDYQHRLISRREALKVIASIVGSLVVANTILAACAPLDTETSEPEATQPSPVLAASPEAALASPTLAAAAVATTTPTLLNSTASQSQGTSPHGTVAPDDPLVIASALEFPGEDTNLLGYLSRPVSGDGAPVILVCHENRGLTPHIQDVTRRLAKAGYVALAIDLLSRQGGTAALDSGDVPGTLGNISPDIFVKDFLAGWRYLQTQNFALTERVGMTGFCFGGGVTWRVATQMPELKAAVPFYGPHPEISDVPNIQAAVQAIYGERDTRINAGIPAIEAAMQENGKIYAKIIYPDSDHAFFNDTGTRYNPTAAQDAWKQLLGWFQQYV
ncbi:MAG TPA: dienelactone hydrolase family protein [Bellilinea sp.]|nr:dienelactone hydrolase family protein [Bellilinea sp.]